jgi:hypothetical protein
VSREIFESFLALIEKKGQSKKFSGSASNTVLAGNKLLYRTAKLAEA